MSVVKYYHISQFVRGIRILHHSNDTQSFDEKFNK